MAQRDQAQDDTTRILIADGDRDSRLAMTWCLLSEGYRIDPVSDGFSAAAALEQASLPTIAIIDLGLQGFGGRRLIHHIHSSPRLRNIHLIATGVLEPLAPLPPGVLFRKKPFDGELLLRTIRSLARDDLRSFFPSRRDHHHPPAHPASQFTSYVRSRTGPHAASRGGGSQQQGAEQHARDRDQDH